ncbi:MAG: EamA family transporter [Acidobacteria bacterium]|nr:EamA family transporter [Acidobacteriota bacterium]
MTPGRRKTKAVLQVAGAALLFSTGGAAIKTAAFSAMQVASIRSGIAAAMLLLWFRGQLRWSPRAAAVGVVYAATLVLFVAATKLTTAASAIFLQSTAPLYVALVGPVLLGERFRRRDIGVLVAVAVGLALCISGSAQSTATAPDPSTGNLLGAMCGATWGLTLLGLRWMERSEPGTAVSAVATGNVLAFLVGVPAMWPLPAAPVAAWATLGYLGVFQIGMAYILLTAAVGELPALDASLLLLLEPVLNPVWTWLVRSEQPGGWTLVGGAVILAASAAQMRSESRLS